MFPLNYSEVYKSPATYKPPEDAKLLTDTEYPNLNSRSYTTRVINHTLSMHPAWECISLNKNDHAVIATSLLSGREWYSTLWGFEQLDEITQNKSCFKLRLHGIISGLKSVTDDIYILGLHTGHVQVWSTYAKRINAEERSPYCPFKIGEKCANSSQVSCLDAIKNDAVTGSKDGTLQLWDMGCADLFVTHTYHYAHLENITSVAIAPTNSSLITTCSFDKSVMLWDMRLPRPAKALYENHEVGFKAVAFHNNSATSDVVFVGDECGFIYGIDPRCPSKFFYQNQWLDRPIRKISIKNNNMAVIGDTNTVKILLNNLPDTNNENQIFKFYENNETTNFVRDGVWRNNSDEFLTVGFEGKMRRHVVEKK